MSLVELSVVFDGFSVVFPILARNFLSTTEVGICNPKDISYLWGYPRMFVVMNTHADAQLRVSNER